MWEEDVVVSSRLQQRVHIGRSGAPGPRRTKLAAADGAKRQFGTPRGTVEVPASPKSVVALDQYSYPGLLDVGYLPKATASGYPDSFALINGGGGKWYLNLANLNEADVILYQADYSGKAGADTQAIIDLPAYQGLRAVKAGKSLPTGNFYALHYKAAMAFQDEIEKILKES